MELHALLHERNDGLATDITIALEFGDSVTIEHLSIGCNRDTTKTAITGDGVWCMTIHKVGVLGLGIDSTFNLHYAIVELEVLLFGIMCVATRQNLLAEFEEYWMLALATDGGYHLLIALSCIALKILESEGGGDRCAYTCVGKVNDVVDDAVEMAGTTHLGIGCFVETIDANLNLADIRYKFVNQVLVPKDSI